MSIIFPDFCTAYFLPDDEEYFRQLTKSIASETVVSQQQSKNTTETRFLSFDKDDETRQDKSNDSDCSDYPRYRPPKCGTAEEDEVTLKFFVREDLVTTSSGKVNIKERGMDEVTGKECINCAVTVCKRVVPYWYDEDNVERSTYDIHVTSSEMDLTADVDATESPFISQATSFEDIEKLMNKESMKSLQSQEDLGSQSSFEIIRNAGMHNILSATGTHSLDEITPKDSRNDIPQKRPKFSSILIRADLAPHDYIEKNFKPLDEDLRIKWSFVNSGMVHGVNCIVVEPKLISIKLEQWVNWSTLMFSLFGSYLSLSILVVGLTKLNDHRTTILGLANVWLFKEYRKKMESDPVCHYRNLNVSKPEDMKIVMRVFEPMPSRAKFGRVFMKDSSIIITRKIILHSLMLTQLVCTMYKLIVSRS